MKRFVNHLLMGFPLAMVLLLWMASPGFAFVDDRLLGNPVASEWLVNKTDAQITTELNKGYRITDLKITGTNPVLMTVAIVKNEGPYAKAWWWHPSLSQAEVGSWLQTHHARLTLLKPYSISPGNIKYAAVMVDNTASEGVAWSWYPNHTLDQIIAALKKTGDRIVDIEQFSDSSLGTRYSAVTVNNAGSNKKGTAVFAGWKLSDIQNWMNSNPSLMMTVLHDLGNGLYLGVATESNVAHWTFLGVTPSQVNNLLGRYWARPIQLDPHSTGSGTFYNMLMVDNGQGITGIAKPGFEAYDQVMHDLLKKYGIPGASLSLVKQGKLIYSRGYGFADIENQVLASPTTVFRVGSVSKTITSISLMKLMEKLNVGGASVLTLDTPVFKNIILPKRGLSPSILADPRINEITLRDLLNHTAGWDENPNPMTDFSGFSTTPTCEEIVLRMIKTRKLVNDPGKVNVYSNFSPCVVATVIQDLSQEKYEAFAEKNVIAAAGIGKPNFIQMLPSSDFKAQKAPLEAVYYDYPLAPQVHANMPELGGAMVDSPYAGIPLKPGISCGGWAASTVGLARLSTAIDNTRAPQILTPASYQQFFDGPPAIAYNPSNYYGLFWAVWTDPGNVKYLWHNGGIPGTGARFVINYGGLTWAVAFNSTEDPTTLKPGDPSAEWDLYAKMIAAKVTAQPAIDKANWDLFPTYGIE